MYIPVLTVVGGLGMFLLGMMVLTDGLRNLAGASLHRFLQTRTKSPFSGALAGALTTAVLQSSSATTVATVGFVGAGLITFSQALGIIFGANLGTTVTGWLVALVGFKLQLGLALMPLTLAGVLLKMFAGGWLKNFGWALAGFSLLFIGIASLQQGMAALEGVVTPSSFPADNFVGRVQLVGLGAIITLITQSSSAGVATALVALAGNAISFPQAAVMVIGMDVGTTFTAAFASLGGTAATRRTGFAHVIYNVMIGTMAFVLLYPLEWGISAWQAAGHMFDPQIGLVAFHTAFNLLGLCIVIGFTPVFARLVIWLVPDRGPALTSQLDDRLLGDASVATYAAGASVAAISQALLGVLEKLLDHGPDRSTDIALTTVADALRETRAYSQNIKTEQADAPTHMRHMAIIHSLDHLSRLHHRCGQEERISKSADDPELSPIADQVAITIRMYCDEREAGDAESRINGIRHKMEHTSQAMRQATIDLASRGATDTETALLRLDAIRWLRRVSYHIWRIMVHHSVMEKTAHQAGKNTPVTADDVDGQAI